MQESTFSGQNALVKKSSILSLNSLNYLPHTLIHTHTFTHLFFQRLGRSLSPHSGVRQCGRDTSPRRQYRFGTPWPAVPSETPPLSCTCQQKQKPLCQAAAPLPPSKALHPSLAPSGPRGSGSILIVC